jgi:hypothetical protein
VGDKEPGNQTSKKRKRATAFGEEEDDIKAFQRVRLLLKFGKLSLSQQHDPLNSCAGAHPSSPRPMLGTECIEMDRHSGPGLLPVTWGTDVNPTPLAWTYDSSGFHYIAEPDTES